MHYSLVRCGPYLSHILTLALILGKTRHVHTMLTKLSIATVAFHKIAYFSHSTHTLDSVPPSMELISLSTKTKKHLACGKCPKPGLR